MQFNARKTLLALAAFVTGLALAVAPTLGANLNVTSGGGSNTFSPKTVTVTEGDSVTWTNASGNHNVKFDDGSFERAPRSLYEQLDEGEDLQRRRVLPLLLRGARRLGWLRHVGNGRRQCSPPARPRPREEAEAEVAAAEAERPGRR